MTRFFSTKTQCAFRAALGRRPRPRLDVGKSPVPRDGIEGHLHLLQRVSIRRAASTSPSLCHDVFFEGFPEASAALRAHRAAREPTRAHPQRRRAPRVTQGRRDGPFRRARATVRLEPDPGPIRAPAVRPDFKRPTRTWRDRHRAAMPRGGPTLTARLFPHPAPSPDPTGTSCSTSRATPCP